MSKTDSGLEQCIFYIVVLGMYDQGIKLLDDYIKKNKTSGRAYMHRGLAWQKLGRLEKAYADYEQAYKYDDSDKQKALTLINRASLELEMNNYDEAIESCTEAISLDPNSMKALYQRAYVLAEAGRYEDSVNDLTKLIDSGKEPAFNEFELKEMALRKRAQLHIKLRDFEKCLADCNALIELNSKDAEAYKLRGQMYDRQGENKLAKADLLKAEAFEWMPEAQDLLADGSNEKAIKLYSKIISRCPDEWIAFANRGIGYSELRELDKAIADFSTAIELCPEDDEYAHENFYNRAMAYSRLKKPEQSIEDYGRAIELSSEPSHYALRGMEYHRLKEYKKAVEDYTASLAEYEDHPSMPDVHYLRALSYSCDDDLDNAVKDIESSLAGYKEYGEEGPYIADCHHLKSIILKFQGNEKESKASEKIAKELGYSPNENKLGLPVLGTPKSKK